VAIVEKAKVRKMVRKSWKKPTLPTSSSRISSRDFHFFSPRYYCQGQEDGEEELEEAHPSHIFLQNLIQGLPLLLS
jgi:hypothetical protein